MSMKIDKVSKQIIVKRLFGIKKEFIDFSKIASISLEAVGCRDALIPKLVVNLRNETQIEYSNTFSAGNNIIKMAEQKATPQTKQQLPNATATLVLGILSIVTGCIFIGLILGIIGLVISSKDKKMYDQNPQAYDGYGSLNAGRILSIIGTILGGLVVLYWIIWVLIIGGAALTFLKHANF